MKRIYARAAAVAFPASSIVIIGVSELQRHGVEISDVETGAAVGLLTWVAIVFLGAGWKAEKPEK